ncbi:MAG TPA: NUDIX domain-containing protein [Gaiellaceae bacterium]|nr:NUDIX domain-containing protein [Gaiellaceae bacterium]
MDAAPETPPATSAVPDVLAPGLRAVFCGINPGRVSAAARAHFANPRNDFWRLLCDAGFTPTVLDPQQQFALLEHGYGLTNAALRTTPGSGDLRRGDFAAAAARLRALADDLRPRVIAFVGKEAYRGTFGERPELGLQERRLGDTALFVLPSTSPANAAVPWEERLRWFRALREWLETPRIRRAARALVVDPADRVLLVEFRFPHGGFWATPGGGVDPGESDERTLRRELAEELGLESFELGPPVWERLHEWDVPGVRWDGQRERCYLVRVPAFEPAPRFTAEQLASEFVHDFRWWTLDELRAAQVPLSPARLPELVAQVLADGPPAQPLDGSDPVSPASGS